MIKNILAVIGGVAIGTLVNMGIITLGASLIPPPEGVDAMDVESLKKSIHLFEAKHYISPFLAHALGTLAGAWVAALIAATHKARIALVIGVFFMLGGIANAFMLPAPAWFILLDLIGAYLPMAWLGGKWGSRKRESITP